MRILLAFTGGRGHFEPLLPLARAAARAGHDVRFAATPSQAGALEALGFRADRIGLPGDIPPPDRRLLPLDLRREERDFRERFAGTRALLGAPLVLELLREWKADVLVADETDFGSLIAAERLGVPYASVVVLAAGTFVRPDLVAATLDEVRASQGLAPDPDLEALSRYLVLSPVPPSFRDPGVPAPATLHAIRPAALDDPRDDPPEWLSALGRPLVYFTLGTVFNLESGDLFDRVLAGLGESGTAAVATTGAGREPAELNPPANVRLERFLAQDAILPRCDLVASHGGSGTVVGALAHGVPQVLVPIGADQEPNARRCRDLGVARVLDAVTATPAEVREAVGEVLGEGSYREGARRVQAEAEALPGAEHALALVEQLAQERQPIPA